MRTGSQRSLFVKIACMNIKSFIVVVLSAVLVACSAEGDLNENDINSNTDSEAKLLLGTWQLTHSKGYEKEDGIQESWDEDCVASVDYCGKLIFTGDGKGKLDNYGDGDDVDDFTWTYKDKKLTMKLYGILTLECPVSKITAKELIIEFDMSEGTSYTFISTDTYKKI